MAVDHRALDVGAGEDPADGVAEKHPHPLAVLVAGDVGGDVILDGAQHPRRSTTRSSSRRCGGLGVVRPVQQAIDDPAVVHGLGARLQAGARRTGDGGMLAERLQVRDQHVPQPAEGRVAVQGRLGEDREVVQGGEIALLALEAGVDERDVGHLLARFGERHARDVDGAGGGPAAEAAEPGLGGMGERGVVALRVHRATATGGDPGGVVSQ
jgi:hypothetical protein